MTNKQFVKSIYKHCFCKQFYMGSNPLLFDHNFIVYIKVARWARREAIGWGETRKQAWKDGAEFLKKQVLKTLEK